MKAEMIMMPVGKPNQRKEYSGEVLDRIESPVLMRQNTRVQWWYTLRGPRGGIKILHVKENGSAFLTDSKFDRTWWVADLKFA